MVVLNFTLFVELGLFLIFLWGCHVFIFKPVLRQLDEREHKVTEDIDQAQQEQATATLLEEEYARQMAAVRRSVSEEFRQARQAAQHEQDALVAQLKKQVDEEIEHARARAQKEVDEQRPDLERLAPELAVAVAGRLGLRESS